MKLGRAATRMTCAVLLSFSIVLPINPASATTPLTRAVVEALRNQVRLLQQNRSARPASVSDTITPGDGVATGQSSLAELRFNDGSLARVGEQVVFWFTPQTRSFRLSNGTLLMLIPPGQGGTRIQTPNVTTGIRGSALFVRHDAETNTTLVGALTNSGIEVSNADNTQRIELQAGQMAVVVEDAIQQLYEFDLDTFYQTSPLVEGLKLDQTVTEDEMEASSEEERAIASVRAETVTALQAQQFDENTEVATQVFRSDTYRLTTPEAVDNIGVDTIQDSVSTDLDQITTGATVPLEGVVDSIADDLINDDLVDSVDSAVNDTVNDVGNVGNVADDAVVDDAINDVGNVGNIVNDAGNIADDIDNSPAGGNGPVSDIVDGVVDLTDGVVNDAVGGLVDGVDTVIDTNLMDLINDGVFPGQGNGVIDGFPGQGNGVVDGFPGRGNGAQNGNNGQGNGSGNGQGQGNQGQGNQGQGNQGQGNGPGNNPGNGQGNQGQGNGPGNNPGNGQGNGNGRNN